MSQVDWDAEIDRQYHPVSQLFPLLEGDEFDHLKADIAENGLLEAIWLDQDGRIIDGRNRHRACIETHTDPRFRTWTGTGSLVTFVVSLNLHRRHLSYDQRMGIGLQLVPAYAEEANARMLAGTPAATLQQGRAAEKAAEQAQVGTRALYEMRAAEKDDPALPEKLIAGQTTVREVRKERKRNERVERIQEIAQGNTELDTTTRYPVIYADPPWRYEHSKTDNRAIENQYPSMSIEDICDLPVSDLATDDAVLFLWATSPKLAEAINVINSWGFTYRTSMVWVKDKIGMGYYARQRHELLLIATRGSLPVPEPGNRHDSVIEFPRPERHSEKPPVFAEIIEAMCPEYPKIELFCRDKREGWEAWGNQA